MNICRQCGAWTTRHILAILPTLALCRSRGCEEAPEIFRGGRLVIAKERLLEPRADTLGNVSVANSSRIFSIVSAYFRKTC